MECTSATMEMTGCLVCVQEMTWSISRTSDEGKEDIDCWNKVQKKNLQLHKKKKTFFQVIVKWSNIINILLSILS